MTNSVTHSIITTTDRPIYSKAYRYPIDDPAYIEAFQKLKRIITSPPILSYPDFNKKFIVTTDTSSVAVGAVLSQEKNYSTIEKELLAIVWAIGYFRPYLYGVKFLVRTDHQPLKWLSSLKEPNYRLIRWKIKLGEYEFDIEYVKGKDNKVADFSSRLEQNTRQTDPVMEYVIDIIFNRNSLRSSHRLWITQFC